MKTTITLNNGVEMPHIGFGTYPLCGEQLHTSLRTALDCGCRLIDSANSYPNENSIGEALEDIFQTSPYRREDVFLTSKIGDKLDDTGFPIGYYFYNSPSCPNKNHREVVFEQVETSLRKLRTDYVDLLLIHWPYNDCLEEIWQAFEEIYRQGKARAIGVSNCRVRHLQRIAQVASIAPMVNQIYVTPLNTQQATHDFCKANDIAIEAYSPLMFINSNNSVTRSEELKRMCNDKEKTLAQMVLRWNLQRNVIPIPKSGTPSRIKANYSLYDFELSEQEMDFISSFNEDYQFLPESRFCPGY